MLTFVLLPLWNHAKYSTNKSTAFLSFINNYGDYARMMCFIINKLVFFTLVTNVKDELYGIYADPKENKNHRRNI